MPTYNVVSDPLKPIKTGFVEPGAAPTTPPVQLFPYPDEPTTIKTYQDRVKDAYVDAGRTFPDPNDMDAFRWFSRYGFDVRTNPEPDVANKHIADLRKALGVS